MKKMCKKVVSLLLAAVMVLTMTAFASVVYAADEDSVRKQLKSWALTTARSSGNTKFRKTPAAMMQQSTLLDRDALW